MHTARFGWLLLAPCLLIAAGCSGSSSPPADAGPTDAGSADAGSADGGCIGAALLAGFGKQTILAGAAMADTTAGAAAWNVRYEYLAGGIFDSSTPCASCASNCSAAGVSCRNPPPGVNGCGWWGCFQYDQIPPGQYALDFITQAAGRSQLPMFTYYEILQASGASEGNGEVAAANNTAFMTRYLADFRFLLQKIGASTALVQVEPDFWGYAQKVNANPHLIPAAVASANPTDCANQENSIAGLGRCLIAMARKYSSGTRIGLHGSSWGPGPDPLVNNSASLDVAAEARKLGAFLLACGAGSSDFVTSDASDRDSGYYLSIGQNRAWDATNATLPDFHQAFTWAKALAESLDVPVIWWQVPVGNAAQANNDNHWKDNRVDYFFAHTAELAAAHSAGMFFGAGDGRQTTPESDGGNLIAKMKAYTAAGGQRLCSP